MDQDTHPTLADLAANPALAAEVDLDHVPELVGLLLEAVYPPRMEAISHTIICGPAFLAGMVFAITLADHGPWDHHAPHEQAPEQVGVYAKPVTSPTSGSFFFNVTSSTVVASRIPSLAFRA